MKSHLGLLRRHFSFDGVMAAGSATGLALLFADAVHSGRTPLLGEKPASQFPLPSTKETRLSLEQVAKLQDTGYLVVDDFLTKEQVRDACRAVEALAKNGRFKNSPNDDDNVRTDRTFMSKDNSFEKEGLRDVRKTVASFARGIADSTFCGFVGNHQKHYHSSQLNMPCTMQVSIFGCNENKSGAQYFTSHLDSAGTETFLELGLLGWLRSYYIRKRYMTCIVYLNEDWKPGDGGCLRLHRNGATMFTFESDDFLDVEPIAGRLVIFNSLQQWHAVLPSFATRFACSFWLTLSNR
mmetsp:Transcript_8667/g.20794  ORF Transcript_8667/g.20794 Transcript_8667/m.20794 type:complete len:295 (-) Transcript_8667:428-1312(-)|eukprot:CAMPEP_0113644498 /NCGR_PEP_ID=MMETSP0017_2-20120614/23423_1 /TAXON_ID=2856 /ORGANISM="Cylindrotheca closterium" /LENGTH=294 /DNA_ID=CAMNT_0000556119 /DNA_START=72 /DNA_END=956 /DNA_ORIENTATION=- /assembly_acc=CAM_ASM_000147